MIEKRSPGRLRAFALISALLVFGLFATAIFARSPISIIALCLVPLPLVVLIIVSVSRLRLAIEKYRATQRLRSTQHDH
jgi:ABC-type multidrug transport system fused ATPase/permease subunit